MGRQLSCDACCLGMAVCSPNLAEVENCLFPWGSFPGCLEAAGPPQLQNPRQKQCPSLAAPGGPVSALLCTTGAPSPRADIPAVAPPLVCGCWQPAPCSQEPCKLPQAQLAPGRARRRGTEALGSAPPRLVSHGLGLTAQPSPQASSPHPALPPGVGSHRVLSCLVPRHCLGKCSICVFREILIVS